MVIQTLSSAIQQVSRKQSNCGWLWTIVRALGNSRTIEMFAVITGFNMTCSVGEVVSADISGPAMGRRRIGICK